MDKTISLEGIGEIKMIRNNRVKRLAIAVKPFSGVKVNVPYNISFESAEKFIFEKRSWIRKNLHKIRSIEDQYPTFDRNSEYTTREHRLRIIPHDKNTIKLIVRDKSIYAFYPSYADVKDERIQKAIRKAIVETWRIEAKKYLPARATDLALKHGFRFNRISVKNAKTRWGSCSSSNNINLNLQLMRLPEYLIDYIILHELTHTVHKNHGKAFWNMLNNISGNAKGLNREIKRYNIFCW